MNLNFRNTDILKNGDKIDIINDNCELIEENIFYVMQIYSNRSDFELTNDDLHNIKLMLYNYYNNIKSKKYNPSSVVAINNIFEEFKTSRHYDVLNKTFIN